MKIVNLTFLQFYVLALIDAGKHEGIGFGEVKDAVRSGQLFSWLRKRFPGEVDTSPYTDSYAKVGQEVIQALQQALEGLDGRERKKIGIENNGVCLLAGLITEAIQQNRGTA